MSFDRGFIKWQPFNSVIDSKSILREINTNKTILKPSLFPEEIEELNNLVRDYYYSKEVINITYYEAGKIKTIKTIIKDINPNDNTIRLANKTICFNQIINITSSS